MTALHPPRPAPAPRPRDRRADGDRVADDAVTPNLELYVRGYRAECSRLRTLVDDEASRPERDRAARSLGVLTDVVLWCRPDVLALLRREDALIAGEYDAHGRHVRQTRRQRAERTAVRVALDALVVADRVDR